MIIPAYRFTYKNRIFLFGIMGAPMSLAEFTEYVERWAFIKFFDGTHIDTSLISDLRVADVECPVGFILFPNGQMARSY